MGCDIHAVFQKPVKRGTWSGWEDVDSEYDENRHYFLFAWLADVRNGYGFAGIPTHTPVVPIAQPRGYPSDFYAEDDEHSPHYDFGPKPKRYRLTKWMGDHSHSWLTLDEILAAPLPADGAVRTGVVPREWFESWDGRSQPPVWSGDIVGANIKVSDPGSIEPDTTHVRIKWNVPTDELDYFLDEVRRLKELHGGDARMVFGFDS